MTHPVDKHKLAVEYANNNTRRFFGDDAVPTDPGSLAQDFWLIQFDAVYALPTRSLTP